MKDRNIKFSQDKNIETIGTILGELGIPQVELKRFSPPGPWICGCASDKVLFPLYPHQKNITYIYIYPHLEKCKVQVVQVAQAVDKVQMLVLKTYSFIRSQVCDQATTILWLVAMVKFHGFTNKTGGLILV